METLIELKLLNSSFLFELFELVLLYRSDKQFPVEQSEPTVSQSTVPSPPSQARERRRDRKLPEEAPETADGEAGAPRHQAEHPSPQGDPIPPPPLQALPFATARLKESCLRVLFRPDPPWKYSHLGSLLLISGP